MPGVSNFFQGRWLWSLLGTLALGVLLWSAGDLLSINGRVPLADPTRRALLIAALVLVWALAQLFSAVRTRLRETHLLEQLAIAPERDAVDPSLGASADELARLDERFQEAVHLLRSRRTRRRLGVRSLSKLPWYLIIGPPGCGKTTALLNSGLSFPLAEDLGPEPIQGIGGTRHCDWWFTREAVLLDTAGRYTTQDSYEPVDRAGWAGFLALLKKHRPQRPINGVLVAVSVADILQQSSAERDAQAKAIRRRLQELEEAFRIRPPVYVLVMKADLIAGFMEFFADLGKDGREQVWGVALPLDAEGVGIPPVDNLRSELGTLLQRLLGRRLARMHQERDSSKRALIFAFPQQFAALEAPLDAFVRDIFRPDGHRSRPMLRGLYFTSGTQTGTPIDRVLAGMATSLGFSKSGEQPIKGTGRGYFLTRVFRDLVFPESYLAGLDPRAERRRHRHRVGAFAFILVVSATTAVAWTISYGRNRALIAATEQAMADVNTKIAALDASDRDPIALLPLLDSARALSGSDRDQDAVLPMLRWVGLDQRTKLGPEATRAYRRILQRTLLPWVTLRLEDQIRGAGGDPELLYDAMRIYLMLDAPSHYDGEMLRYWMSRDLDRSLFQSEVTEQEREALKDHLEALFNERPTVPMALDNALIAKTREILTRTPLPQRLYDQIKREGLGPGFSDFKVSDAAGDYAKLVFERRSGRALNEGIPALYTYHGYHHGFDEKLEQLLLATAQDSWILGTEAELEPETERYLRVVSDVRQLYFRDYVAVWDELIQDIDINPPRDLRHAAEMARILADPEQSPLRRLLLAIRAQTDLQRRPDTQLSVSEDGQQAPAGFQERVDRYFEDAAADSPRLFDTKPEAYVARRFLRLQELLEAPEGQPVPLERAQAALDRAYLLLNSMAAAASSGRGALAAHEKAQIDDLKDVADDLPSPLSQLLARLAQDSADIVSGGMRAQLNRLWTAEVLPFCREAIHDRYPFEPLSSRETTLHDFARILGPDGLLETYFDENLAQLVDTKDDVWKWNDSDIDIPNEVLEQFQRAASIRQAFFAEDSKLPRVQMELAPLALDPDSRGFVLELGDQIIHYRPESPEIYPLSWPAPAASRNVYIQFIDRIGARPGMSFSGPWSWFRLLEAGEMTAMDQPENYEISFSFAGHEAQFRLRATGVRDPFNFQDFRGFRCPDRL